jgi:hypothetical protein
MFRAWYAETVALCRLLLEPTRPTGMLKKGIRL